jgi:hypothetical protein
VTTAAPPEAVATMFAAVADGLLLHALLDPEVDVSTAITALHVVLTR